MQEKDFENQGVVLQSASALMDDEGSELDLRRVLKASSDNPEVLGHWQRYHLVRASLRQDLHRRPEVNLLAGIHARLEAEAVPKASPAGRGLWRRMGQGAIAASVAFTALYAASWLQVPDDSGEAQGMQALAVEHGTQMPSLGGDFTPSELTRTVSMDAAARKRLRQAVYQSSGLQQHPFGEPYVFPDTPESESATAAELPLDPASLR